MKITNHRVHEPVFPPVKNSRTASDPGAGFAEALAEASGGRLKVSSHAEKRISQRGIAISDQLWSRVEADVNQAKHKGVKDSLVLTKEAAFIVNASSSTVITAMLREEASSRLFTNINGTIIIDDH
ncbi:TIGR02530 family flagellar biosynthesis protein [Alteribacter natronophilus]|uniref:TIGR02530 family flagellar biosynthesis protein n=1 Tax=Alteribacter natronophilus TaxID=2583810 RepID=UPI00110DF48C|nr:TIGR02530 family flagellar biosynthesis protein [Alteribacter natronophilus]TMW73219.1 hypothetical protein FGB90_02600 [Alteribacter natronophilus]